MRNNRGSRVQTEHPRTKGDEVRFLILYFLPSSIADALDAYNTCFEFEKSAPPDSAAPLRQAFRHCLLKPSAATSPQAFVRDGFWCIVSGKYDKNTLSEVLGLEASIDEIWEVDHDNLTTIQDVPKRYIYRLPPEIAFTSPDNENLPVPSSPCTLLVPRLPSFLGH
ncbi:hypothetical protein ARMGADRAFT_1032169 [Armillaria gallica]|uniref:Uncharacterized protein n=1 Tax=Armillaria gallica TaxID=47427 RepID=A0A2H3DBG3_ARMGA|nr:hypothetical protein ARMGADRAFT_1032169 [Armillaria gallica]